MGLTGKNYVIVKNDDAFNTTIYDKKAKDIVIVKSFEFGCVAGECQYLNLHFTMANSLPIDCNWNEKDDKNKIEALLHINNLKKEDYDGNYKEGKVSIKAAPGMWDTVYVVKTGGGCGKQKLGEDNEFPRHVVDIKLIIDPSSSEESKAYITLSPSGAPHEFSREEGLHKRITETIAYDLDKFVLDDDVFDKKYEE